MSKLRRKVARRGKPTPSQKLNRKTKQGDETLKDLGKAKSTGSHNSGNEVVMSQKTAWKSNGITDPKGYQSMSKDNEAQIHSRIDATTKISQEQTSVDPDAASKPARGAVVVKAKTGYSDLHKQEVLVTEAEKITSDSIEGAFELSPFFAEENVNGDKKAVVTTVTEITSSGVMTPGNFSLGPSIEIETKVRAEGEADSVDLSTTDARELTLKEEGRDIETILGPAVAKWHLDVKPKKANQEGERYEIRLHPKGQTTLPVTLPGGGVIFPSGVSGFSGSPSRSGCGSSSSRPSSTIKPRKKRGHV